MQNFYILFAFLLTAMAWLKSVSFYCYLIKYQVRQLLPFHYTWIKRSFILINVLWKWVIKSKM